jgi:hypothetical protein
VACHFRRAFPFLAIPWLASIFTCGCLTTPPVPIPIPPSLDAPPALSPPTPAPGLASLPPIATGPSATAHAGFQRVRARSEMLVKILRRHLPTGSGHLVEGERLYEDAREGVSAWVAAVRTAVESDQPGWESSLSALRETAGQQSQEFQTFVDALLRERLGAFEATQELRHLPPGTFREDLAADLLLIQESNRRRQADRSDHAKWVAGERARLELVRWPAFTKVK